MNGVLRIALTYFSVMPLHRWVSIVSAGLLLLGVTISALDPGAGAGTAAFAMLGAVMLSMGPLMMGGGMHRAASSRTLMHLRPNGRLRMLLAATLVVTLLAIIATLPVLVSHAMPADLAHKAPFRQISPFTMFAVAWSIAALMWAGIFITSTSQLQGLLFVLLPLVLVKFGKTLAILLPSAPAVLATGGVVWLAFALWYMHVRSLRPMPSVEDLATTHPIGKLSGFMQKRFESLRGAMSFTGVTNQYLLGSSSPARSAVVFGFSWVLLACVLLFLLITLVLPNKGGAAMLISGLLFLPVSMVSTAALGFSLTRRARLLWIRPGHDRTLLFTQAERGGLAFTMPALAIAIAAFLAFSLLTWPEHSTRVFFFAAAQAVFAIGLFYCGMSLTRGWAVQDILLGAAMCIFFVAEVVLLRPWKEEPAGATTILGIVVLLVPALRWHARRRWRAIDWRVARMLVARRPA